MKTPKTTTKKGKVQVLDVTPEKGLKTQSTEIVNLSEKIESQDRLALMSPVQLKEQISTETEKRKIITDYISKHMKDGVDYGRIHIVRDCKDKKNCKINGHWSKHSLFKPGAEKFCSLFRYKAEYVKDVDTWEMLGSVAGTLALICRLYTSGSNILVGEGRGVCTVKEKGGDANVAIKLCQKRAKVDAVLQTGGLSDFFTQDLEDMKLHDDEKDISTALIWSEKTRLEPIKFGKNKGVKWCDLHLNYLEWANTKMDNPEILKFVRAELDFRTPKHTQTPQTGTEILTWSEASRKHIVAFGKFKGTTWNLLSTDYLKWLASESKDEKTINFAKGEINYRLNTKIDSMSLLTKSQIIQILRLIDESFINEETKNQIINEMKNFTELKANSCINWLKSNKEKHESSEAEDHVVRTELNN